MADAGYAELTPGQAATLARVLAAGFKLVTLERFARYPAVERDGFMALLDTSNRGVKILGQAGYHMGEGIGMLIERGPEREFVWHGQSLKASPELLETYERFKTELTRLLEESV